MAKIITYPKKQTLDQPYGSTQADKIIQSTSTTPATKEEGMIPEKDTLYLGIYNGKDAIFLTNEEKQKYFDPGAVPKTGRNIGELLSADGIHSVAFDFGKLQNPKRIFSNKQRIHSVNGFKLNNSKSAVYISINYGSEINGQYPNLVNKIYQIKLSPQVSSEIWSNEIGSKKYEGAEGAAYVATVEEDKFLTISLINCYACEGTTAGTIILNILTKVEKYFTNIGSLKFNIPINNFSYQKLAPFQESCDSGPGCDNGQRSVMKPAGQIYTENLP